MLMLKSTPRELHTAIFHFLKSDHNENRLLTLYLYFLYSVFLMTMTPKLILRLSYVEAHNNDPKTQDAPGGVEGIQIRVQTYSHFRRKCWKVRARARCLQRQGGNTRTICCSAAGARALRDSSQFDVLAVRSTGKGNNLSQALRP